MTKIRLQLLSLETDTAQYKPFSPKMEPVKPLYVEFDVPDSEVYDSKETVILTQDGFSALLADVGRTLYSAWESYNTERLLHVQSKNR